jgi:4'-phosphopantetheinyl transferase EntD
MRAAPKPIFTLSFGSKLKISIGLRAIEPGDEDLLKKEEAVSFEKATVKLRRQSGAVRDVARALLAKRGEDEPTIRKAHDGAPVWPHGVVGSLAHDDNIAVAAVASNIEMGGVGIDVEPCSRLPDDVYNLVLTPREKRLYLGKLPNLKQIFVLKEAVYKAWYPSFQSFLDFQEIELDIEHRSARVTVNDKIFSLGFRNVGHLIGLAYFPAHPSAMASK